jgi:hypothetical protein
MLRKWDTVGQVIFEAEYDRDSLLGVNGEKR